MNHESGPRFTEIWSQSISVFCPKVSTVLFVFFSVRTNCEQNQNSDELGLGHEMDDDDDVASGDPLHNADSNADFDAEDAEENDHDDESGMIIT